MGAEPLLPEVKAQDGNSIGNSILKKRKKESKSLLINIELPIELPPLSLASARRCLWSGLCTAMSSVSPARVWPWPMSSTSLVRAWPRLRPGAQDQAHAQRCPSSARSSSAAEYFGTIGHQRKTNKKHPVFLLIFLFYVSSIQCLVCCCFS